MHTDRWHQILISGNFGYVGEDLRNSIAEMAKRLCQERSANYLANFLACRLIPLEKQLGVRPIGTSKVLRRVIRKIVIKPLRKDILKTTGSLQLCADQEAGSEAEIHLVYMFNEDDTEAVLMVNRSNAFNSINREAFLQKHKSIMSGLRINNCSSIPRDLFVQGGKCLK